MAIFLGFAELIFVKIGIDRETCFYAGQYVTYVIPGLFFHLNYDAIKSYLNGIGFTYVPMIIMFTTCCLHYLWCYLYIERL
jgi:Na+-driven multidrug efflux pump